MDATRETPGYWAVIPATVRYDDRLKPMEKIMYAEIEALSQKSGVCYAQNSYFMKLYNVGESTVRGWVSNLKKYGYIFSENETKNGMVTGRRMWTFMTIRLPAENLADVRQKNSKPPAENLAGNNTNMINTNTPLPPQGDASENVKGFEKFWAAYPRKVAKKPALRAWQKAKPDDKKLAAILDGLEQWKQCPNWLKDGGAFVPYPAKFLNQEYWMSPPTTQKEEAPLMPEGFQLIPNERGEMQWVQI